MWKLLESQVSHQRSRSGFMTTVSIQSAYSQCDIALLINFFNEKIKLLRKIKKYLQALNTETNINTKTGVYILPSVNLTGGLYWG